MERKAYPSDVSDEEWALVAPYLTLMTEDAPQRDYPLREVFNGLRWIVRTGAPWRWMPHDLPPWNVVYQQSQRRIKAGVFESLVYDLRAVLRVAEGRKESPTAAIIDSRTLQSTPESGGRAGYDGAKRRKGSKVHLAVDTLGHLLALCVTATDEQDRAQVSEPAKRAQEETGQTVEIAYVDQGYTGENAADAAEEHGIKLEVVKLPTAKRGFVLLPRRWVIERSFGWMSRFRRLARDYECLPETLAGLHYVAFVILLALQLWQSTGDQQGEAYILNEIGAVHTDLRELQKAVDHYTQALPLRKAIGDRGEEAITLNNLGFAYSLMGEWQKALDNYNQALPLRKSV